MKIDIYGFLFSFITSVLATVLTLKNFLNQSPFWCCGACSRGCTRTPIKNK